MRLEVAELYALVARHGAVGELGRVLVAGALAESGGDPQAVGDDGHAVGLWQLHDQGLGAGLTVSERMDPDLSARIMVPVYAREWERWGSMGFVGEERALRTYLWAERPYQFQDLSSQAAQRFLAQYRALPLPPSPPDFEAMWARLENWRAHVQGVWVPEIRARTRSPVIRAIVAEMAKPV